MVACEAYQAQPLQLWCFCRLIAGCGEPRGLFWVDTSRHPPQTRLRFAVSPLFPLHHRNHPPRPDDTSGKGANLIKDRVWERQASGMPEITRKRRRDGGWGSLLGSVHRHQSKGMIYRWIGSEAYPLLLRRLPLIETHGTHSWYIFDTHTSTIPAATKDWAIRGEDKSSSYVV